MKTIQDCQKEIDEIKKRIENEELKKGVESKLRKRVSWLRVCIKYLETNPDHLFIRKEIIRVEDMITRRMILFILDDAEKIPKGVASKLKREHEKKYEIPKFREQVRTMRFLLKP